MKHIKTFILILFATSLFSQTGSKFQIGALQPSPWTLDESDIYSIGKNIGVGTSTPLSLIDILGNDPQIAFIDTSEADLNKQVWTMKAIGENLYFDAQTEFSYFGTGTPSLYPNFFHLNSTDQSVFAQNLRVGSVGTPEANLHVGAASSDGVGIMVNNTSSEGTFKKGILYHNGTNHYGITGWRNALALENQAEGNLVLGTYEDGHGILFQTAYRQNRMFIDSLGQVGIGTISPEEELHVYNATGDVEVRAEGLDRSIFRLKNNSVGEEGDLYSISFRSDLDDIIHEYYDASTSSYHNIFSYNTTDQSMSLNPTSLLLNGSSSITGNPILAGANVGWKESYFQSAYARGISPFGIFDKTGGWIYFGNSNSSNNGSSDLIDSGANVGINAAQNNIQFKNRTTDPATPRADYGAFYVKNDEPYFIDDAGTATKLGGGGALLQAKFAQTSTARQTIQSITPVVITGLSASITPQSATSIIEVTANVCHSNYHVYSLGVFKDGATTTTTAANSNEPNMQVTGYLGEGSGGELVTTTVLHYETSGNTTARTYDIRFTSGWAGANSYPNYINGRSTSDMGCRSYMTVKEIAQ